MLAQEVKSIQNTRISEEMQLFVSTSDSLDRIEEMIQDTFTEKKDTLLGLAYWLELQNV